MIDSRVERKKSYEKTSVYSSSWIQVFIGYKIVLSLLRCSFTLFPSRSFIKLLACSNRLRKFIQKNLNIKSTKCIWYAKRYRMSNSRYTLWHFKKIKKTNIFISFFIFVFKCKFKFAKKSIICNLIINKSQLNIFVHQF